LVAADQVGGTVQPQVSEACGGEAGAETLIADQDNALVVSSYVGCAVWAGWVEPPLQHVAVDDNRARQFGIAEALLAGTYVNNQGTSGLLCGQVLGADPVDAGTCVSEQVFDCAAIRAWRT